MFQKLEQYQHTWNRVKRFVRLIFDLPVILTCHWLHQELPAVTNRPKIILSDGAVLYGYTIIIDNRGNEAKTIIDIQGSYTVMNTCHIRVLETPFTRERNLGKHTCVSIQ